MRFVPVVRIVSLGCLAGLLAGAASSAEPARATAIDFVPQPGFLQLPPGFALGPCSAVAVSGKGEIYVFHRGPRPILCFDSAGKLLRAWGDDVIKIAHGLRVDRDDHVWATDIGAHRVFKFSPTGELLLTLGSGEAGASDDHFDKPTDVAFGAAGEIYVADGYGNSRVVKFDATGKRLAAWGTRGKGRGEFHLPHSLVVDSEGRVLVGDRENDRIQVFDADGRWLATWNGFAPYGQARDPDGRLFVADGRASQVLLLNDRGEVQARWGKKGEAPGEFRMPHMLAFNAAGDLFVAEVDGRRLQRFTRTKGAP